METPVGGRREEMREENVASDLMIGGERWLVKYSDRKIYFYVGARFHRVYIVCQFCENLIQSCFATRNLRNVAFYKLDKI